MRENLSSNLVKIFFFFLILLLPSQLGKHFWPDFSFLYGLRIDYLSPTFYFTDLLVIFLLFGCLWQAKVSISPQKILKFFPETWPWFVFFLYLLMTAYLAQNQAVAFYKTLKLLEVFLLGLYLYRNQKNLVPLLALPLSLAVLFESILALSQFVYQRSLGGLWWFLGERTFFSGTPGIALAEIGDRSFLRPYGSFSHPNSLAGFLILGSIMIIGLGRNLPMLIKIPTLFLSGLVIFLSFSQGVWLAMFLVFLWWLLKGVVGQRKSLLAIALLLLTLTFLLWQLPYFRTNESVVKRVELLSAGLSMTRENLLTGVGPGNFLIALPFYYQVERFYFLQPVHNLFILVLAETGLMGLFIFLWLTFLTFKRALLLKNNYWTAGLLIIVITGFFDHYWLTLPQNLLLGTLFIALLWRQPLSDTMGNR